MALNKRHLQLSIYDFDGTVYNGDSFIDFWKFTIMKKRCGIILVPFQIFMAGLYVIKLISVERLKEYLLLQIKLFDYKKLIEHIEMFWKSHNYKINGWVIDSLQNDKKEGLTTICISASPSFILKSISEKLGFDVLIATDFYFVDGRQTNKLSTPNCRGEEKVNRLNKWAAKFEKSYTIEKFYSDSDADLPLFNIARQKYWVRNGIISMYTCL